MYHDPIGKTTLNGVIAIGLMTAGVLVDKAIEQNQSVKSNVGATLASGIALMLVGQEFVDNWKQNNIFIAHTILLLNR